MKKKYLFLGLVAASIFVIMTKCSNNTQTISPVRKNIIDVVFASGYTVNSDEYLCASNSTGFIAKAYVKEGDSVKVGDLLFQISGDVQSLQLNNALAAYNDALTKADPNSPEIQSLKAQIEQAKIQAELDKKNLDRYSALIKTNAVSQLEYDRVKLQYENSKRNIEILEKSLADLQNSLHLNLVRAKNQLEMQREYYSDYFIKATVNGKVLNVFKKQGELVRRGENLAKIGSGITIIKLFVAEEDINRVKKGQIAVISLNTDKHRTLDATITKIYPAFDKKEQSFVLEAKFNEAKNESNVLANTQLQANIVVNKKDKALVIPRECLSVNNTITLADNSEIAVKAGIISGNWVEIIDGVSEKDKIKIAE